MNKFIKSLTAALLLFCSMLPMQLFAATTPTGAVQVDTLSAAWLSGSAGSRVATNLFNYGVAIYSITIQNQNASATTIGIYDSEDKKIESTASLAIFTKNATPTALPLTNVITTFSGVTQTNVTSQYLKTVKTTASTTIARPLLLNIPTAGSSTTTYTFDPPIYFGRGVTVTNHNATQIITWTYEPLVPN